MCSFSFFYIAFNCDFTAMSGFVLVEVSFVCDVRVIDKLGGEYRCSNWDLCWICYQLLSLTCIMFLF